MISRILLSLIVTIASLAVSAQGIETAPKPLGQNFLKADGSARTMAIFLFDGMTVQDFVGVYSILNFTSTTDLKIDFVSLKRGLVSDERGRLKVYANKSISEINHADIFMIPGGPMWKVLNDKKALNWIKKMYDSSEYTISVCSGAVVLGAAGAISGKNAGTAWIVKDLLAQFGVNYVPTPPPSVDGKLYSAAGAAAGIEIGLNLMEKITGNSALSELAEFASEWNPRMRYRSGDPTKAPLHVKTNFLEWIKSDPIFKP